MRFNPRVLRTAAAAAGDNTVVAIAARLEIPYVSVRRWTSEKGEPKGAALATIERVYGITAAALYTSDAA